jgi:hypothetical protein
MVFAVLSFLYAELRADELFVCGWDEVFVLELNGESHERVWGWRASDRLELPEEFRTLFRTTDECKPVESGQKVLISASSGGLALVERPSGRVLWYGFVGNAHSIEMLPGGRLAVAGSTHENGNRVAIFDFKEPNKELYVDELYSGHGVVWDQERELLWALGFNTLKAYRLKNWETPEPELSQAAAFGLPDSGGHDLYPVSDTRDLVVTTNRQVFLFDRDQHKFRLHPSLRDKERVKGVAVHPVTGRVAYVQAEGENWWAHRIHFLNPSGSLSLPDERIYKARWSQR